MGQYYYAANVDNFQFLKPHDFGDGAKLMEFGTSGAGMAMALAGLLTFNADKRGPWAGARIVVTGDYADEGRFVPPALNALNLYSFLCADADDEALQEAREKELPIPEAKLMTVEAKDWLRTLLGNTDVAFNGGRGGDQLEPIAALEDANLVFDQPEDLVAAMGWAPGESSAGAVSDMYQTLRVNHYPSKLSWGSSVDSSTFTEDPATGKLIDWTIKVRVRDTGRTQQLTLTFPAKKAAIRKWLGVAG